MSEVLMEELRKIINDAWSKKPGPGSRIYASASLTIDLPTQVSRGKKPHATQVDIIKGETRVWFYGTRTGYDKRHVYILTERLGYQQELFVTKEGEVVAGARRGFSVGSHEQAGRPRLRKKMTGSRS